MINKIFYVISKENCEIGHTAGVRWLSNTLECFEDINKSDDKNIPMAIKFTNNALINKLSVQEKILSSIRRYLNKNNTGQFTIENIYEYLKEDNISFKEEYELKKCLINMVLNEIIVPIKNKKYYDDETRKKILDDKRKQYTKWLYVYNMKKNNKN